MNYLFVSSTNGIFSFSTGVSFSEAKLMGLTSSQGTGPMPRDMSFPVPKGGSWHDLYDYIRYSNLTWYAVAVLKAQPVLK